MRVDMEMMVSGVVVERGSGKVGVRDVNNMSRADLLEAERRDIVSDGVLVEPRAAGDFGGGR